MRHGKRAKNKQLPGSPSWLWCQWKGEKGLWMRHMMRSLDDPRTRVFIEFKVRKNAQERPVVNYCGLLPDPDRDLSPLRKPQFSSSAAFASKIRWPFPCKFLCFFNSVHFKTCYLNPSGRFVLFWCNNVHQLWKQMTKQDSSAPSWSSHFSVFMESTKHVFWTTFNNSRDQNVTHCQSDSTSDPDQTVSSQWQKIGCMEYFHWIGGY